jgi:hypothetical protein
MLMIKIPTNNELRELALQRTPFSNEVGTKGEYLSNVLEEFLALQYQYFPFFCYDAMIVNHEHNKELEEKGNKSPTMMVGDKVYDGSTGWSKDGTFKEMWIIPEQLHTFMMHIDPNFWADTNAKTRNSFMKAVLRGDDPYELLRKVYSHYGSNVQETSSKIILN